MTDHAPWELCPWCDDYWCAIHGQHVYECACPEIEEWATSPYDPQYDEEDEQ